MAELIKSSVGLGFLLYMSREFNEAAHVIGIMVAAIPFVLLLHRSFFGIIMQPSASAGDLEKQE